MLINTLASIGLNSSKRVEMVDQLLHGYLQQEPVTAFYFLHCA
jgi:hypothetical protein